MLTVVVFIIILGLLIFVHELGHFLVAIKNGIKAEEFGFGFPPRIIGVQPLYGKELIKIGEKEEISVKNLDFIDSKNREIAVREIKDKTTEVDVMKNKVKWRWIWGKRDTEKEWKKEPGMKEGTIYSLNWIPLGGFVKIKGENGDYTKEKDSFASKSAWVRIKVLFAGVGMNFLLAWLLFILVFIIGSPEAVNDGDKTIKDPKIQISQIISGAPSEQMGIKVGDEVIGCIGEDDLCKKNFLNISEIQEYINNHKGQEITLLIKRGKSELILSGVPRQNYPQNEGALGISLVKTAIVKYPWYEAIIKGFTTTIDIIIVIFKTLLEIIKSLFIGEKVSVDVSGPVGIAYLTKQVTELGFIYILQFAALLSINLGIINGLPLPALDGGRALFVIIEKIKGSPLNRQLEQIVHTIGFVLLILLMIFVTFRDVLRFEIIEKIGSFF